MSKPITVGPRRESAVLQGLRTTQAQTSLHLGAVNFQYFYPQTPPHRPWGSQYQVCKANTSLLVHFIVMKFITYKKRTLRERESWRWGGDQSTTLNVIYQNVCHTLKFLTLPRYSGHCWCRLRNPRWRPRWPPEINARGCGI